jgi:hypothetical protein
MTPTRRSGHDAIRRRTWRIRKSTYFFEWEREWRKIGNFKFAVDDVACLIIPEELHSAAVGFFQTAKAENTGSAYECPFIDPYWSRKKVEKALKSD